MKQKYRGYTIKQVNTPYGVMTKIYAPGAKTPRREVLHDWGEQGMHFARLKIDAWLKREQS